jgi:stage III sporulation protein AB
MQIIKYIILFLILFLSSSLGKILSKKYVHRLEELEEFRNSLNIFKNKIKFTYEPIPDIFEEISKTKIRNVRKIFKNAKEKMNSESANVAWEKSIEESSNNLKEEDKNILKTLSKLLGQTDVEGQVSQIEITDKFLETQIKEAVEEKQKNEKLYTRLGTIIGLAIVIVLA